MAPSRIPKPESEGFRQGRHPGLAPIRSLVKLTATKRRHCLVIMSNFLIRLLRETTKMHPGDLMKFSNSFLFLDGDQAVVQSSGDEGIRREKRAHTKSRNGCTACKRRRVKCDEKVPCGNCRKRKEECQRPDPRRPSSRASKVAIVHQPEPRQFNQVNPFHMELFYHFEKFTVPDLTFPQIWPVMLQKSFHNEFLMHAMLSLAAKHLSILRPQDPRYAEAAMVMLNRSLQSYRETLPLPITVDNCDSRLGTSVLINYMAWSDLDFLEGQSILTNPTAGGLDLSRDLMFLLSGGVRQVFFSAFPIFRDQGGVFSTIATYHPCDHLEEEADRRGTNWRELMERLIALFDDPQYIGTSANRDADTDSSKPEETLPLGWYLRELSCLGGSKERALRLPFYIGNDVAMGAFHIKYMSYLIETLGDTSEAVQLAEKGVTARGIYARIARRLSVLMSLTPFMEGNESSLVGVSNPDGTFPTTLSEERLRDCERYFFTFPMILCFGPFLPFIFEGDSRALVLLYYTYRAARRLLTSSRTWWAGKRPVVMEKLILCELKSRGLNPDVLPE